MSLASILNDNDDISFPEAYIGTLTADTITARVINGGGGGGGGGGNFSTPSSQQLDMNGNTIKGVNWIELKNQNPLGDDYYLASQVINGNSVLTVSQGANSNVGQIYDTFYNPLPASGGGWVPTATSDLDMASHGISDVGGITTNSVTVPNNQIYSVSTCLSVTRDGGTNVGQIYDSHYNPPSLDGYFKSTPATQDLDMSGKNIQNIHGAFIGVSTGASPVYNELFTGSNSGLAITRDGGVNVGYIYDSHYNLPPSSGGGEIVVSGKSSAQSTTEQVINITGSAMQANTRGVVKLLLVLDASPTQFAVYEVMSTYSYSVVGSVVKFDLISVPTPTTIYPPGGTISMTCNISNGVGNNIYFQFIIENVTVVCNYSASYSIITTILNV